LRKLDEQRKAGVKAKGALAQRGVSEAVDRFLRSHGELDQNLRFRGDLEYATGRKYRTKLRLLASFCEREGVSELSDVNLDGREDYHRSRKISLVTWKVELQALRTFFGYCVNHRWIDANPAKEMKPPRNIKPNEVVPYSLTALHMESIHPAALTWFGHMSTGRLAGFL